MVTTIETILVKRLADSAEITINKCDFDADLHEALEPSNLVAEADQGSDNNDNDTEPTPADSGEQGQSNDTEPTPEPEPEPEPTPDDSANDQSGDAGAGNTADEGSGNANDDAGSGDASGNVNDDTAGSGDDAAGDGSGATNDQSGAGDGKSDADGDEQVQTVSIRDAVLQLDPNNPDHWIGNGAPKIEAVQAIVGKGVYITRPAINEVAGDITQSTIQEIKDGGATL